MHYRRLFTAIAVLAFLSLPASAQDGPGLFRRLLDKFGQPTAGLDPNAVYQPAARWSFALTGDLRQAGTSQDRNFKTAMYNLDEYGNLEIDEIPVVINSSLRGSVDKAIGFQVGYGKLNLALSKRFHGEGSNSSFSFDYLSAGSGISVQYFKLSHEVAYDLIFGDESYPLYTIYSDVTNEPGQMRAFIVDAFYAYNQRTFAYSAAYKGNVLQRRSAGSWVFGGKLILSDFTIDPDEVIAAWSGGQARQSSAQVSFGGGYSLNLVALHRQPYGDKEKGLRNLTFNVTGIPMVTLFNQFAVTSYEAKDSGFVPSGKDVMNGKLLLNYMARFGVGYTHDLYTFNLSASSDNFAYRGTSSIVYQGVSNDEVDTSGKFFRWNVSLRLCKHF